ncbi:Fc.00g099700.m01.CDS01 [Cosmosporella sp. VM-42]
MSPIVVRAAARAAGRRQFSLLSAMRNVGRSMESHPFERLPIASKPAKPDWGKEFKRVGSQALFFFPGLAVVLGWPLAAQAIFDGHL